MTRSSSAAAVTMVAEDDMKQKKFSNDDSNPASAEKIGRKMLGWAKKLYDKAGDVVADVVQRRGEVEGAAKASSSEPGQLDVFAASLEQIMAEQRQVQVLCFVLFPCLTPVLLRFRSLRRFECRR